MAILFQTTDPRTHHLAERVFALQFERDPQMEREYDERRKRLMFEDVLYNLSFLDTAVRMDDERIFKDYAVWIYRLICHLPTQLDRARIKDWMVDHYRILGEVLEETLPSEDAAKAAKHLANAIRATLDEWADPKPVVRRKEGRYSGIRSAFLERLLANDTRGAHAVIEEALRSGTPLDDIYTEIIQESMVEIGDLWHQGLVSVDKEHYCTSTTQVILSGFYARIFSTPRNGRRILACSVGSELHEMGIRMVSDLFEYHGWDSLYLGAAVPKEAILLAIRSNAPDLVALSVTMPQHLPLCLEIVETIRSERADLRIAVGGRAFQSTNELWKKWPVDVYTENARGLVDWAEKTIAGRRDS